MNKLSFRLLCQTYGLVVLLAVAILSPLPYSPLALVLFLLMLLTTIRPIAPRLNLAIMLAVLFLLPLMLEPLCHCLTHTTPPPTAPGFIAAIAILPIIYLLDYALRQNAQEVTFTYHSQQRHITTVARAIFSSLLAMLLVSLILSNHALLFASAILALYLLAILLRASQAIPKLPLNIPAAEKRIIAGTTASISLEAASRASIRLHCLLSPSELWVSIRPQRLTLDSVPTELNLTVTPPLAGPVLPQLRVSVMDPRGFIQVNQLINPVELNVIPRAKYAAWLATRYLEQTGAGANPATTPPEATMIPKIGIEYLDSRDYQAGDRLKDVDWKHTLKLSQLIVKEYTEAAQPAAIIAVNLSVADAEEADKLSFNLITTALTLSREAIPTALAVYDRDRVVLTTPVTAPREALKQTLALVKNITPVEFAHRSLQLPDIARLRRNITQLKQVTSEPAQRLASILDFEYRAIQETANNNPATLTLLHIAEHIPSPAFIILVSQLNHDAEALLVTTRKLARRGFTILNVPARS